MKAVITLPLLFLLSPIINAAYAENATYLPDKQMSYVHILVYKEGFLKALGHNHVIHTGQINGKLEVNKKGHGQFSASIPVASFVVDNPADRILSGNNFENEIDAESAQATKNNMLGDRMLHAKTFPIIHIQGMINTITNKTALAKVEIKIRNTTRNISIPVSIVTGKQQLIMSGRFSINQTDFNIKPFSLMGGALAVQNKVSIRFEIVLNKHMIK